MLSGSQRRSFLALCLIQRPTNEYHNPRGHRAAVVFGGLLDLGMLLRRNPNGQLLPGNGHFFRHLRKRR
jgi:hypothetical protein